MEKAREFQKNIYFCFIDYAKAFDCVDHNKLWKILKEMGIPDHLTRAYILIITLNVNGLNAPTKRHRLAGWMDTKTRPEYMLSTRDPPQTQGYLQTESKEMGEGYFMQIEIK